MAGFKKFIVSGSNASLNHIASGNNLDTSSPVAGGISASALYADTQNGTDVGGDIDKIVVVHPTTNEYVSVAQSDIQQSHTTLTFNASDFDGTNGLTYNGGAATTISIDETNLAGDGLQAISDTFVVKNNATHNHFGIGTNAVNLISGSFLGTNFGLSANSAVENMSGLGAGKIGVLVDATTITIDGVNGLTKEVLSGKSLTDGNGIMNDFTYTLGGTAATLKVDTGSLAGTGLSTYGASNKLHIKTGSITPAGFLNKSVFWSTANSGEFVTGSINENTTSNTINFAGDTNTVKFNDKNTEFKGTVNFKHESVLEIADEFLLINSQSSYTETFDLGFQGQTGSNVGRRWGLTGSSDSGLTGRWFDYQVTDIRPGVDTAGKIGGQNLWCASGLDDVIAYADSSNNYVKQTGNMVSDAEESIYMYVA